jgi:ATP-dependent helicase/nuclease subunit A
MMQDREARARIQDDLDVSLLVEASAGTGKTSALVGRMVALLAAGKATVDSLVAVTFTEKAAGELKLRLRTKIEQLRGLSTNSEERDRLADAALALESARIGTIHAFAAELLRQRPVQAGVDPWFAVMADADNEAIYADAFDAWFEQTLQQPGPGVRRILRRKGGYDGNGPRKQLYDAGKKLVAERDLARPWERPKYNREASLDEVRAKLRAIEAADKEALHPDDWLAKSMAHIAAISREIRLLDAANKAGERIDPERAGNGAGTSEGRDDDGAEELLRVGLRGWHKKLWGYRGFRSPYAPGMTADAARALREDTRKAATAHLALCDAELASLLQEELRPLCAAYTERLSVSGRLDFAELLLRARTMLRTKPDVRAEVSATISHIFVDEFQDTDPLQLEVLWLLASVETQKVPTTLEEALVIPIVPGKLFVVGDPKQSIYRFRRADMRLYHRAKEALSQNGAVRLELTENFRSKADLLACFNAGFGATMKAGPEQPNYAPMTGGRSLGENASAQAQHGPFPVIALPVPAPYSPNSGKVSAYYMGQSFPIAVSAFVEWLVNKSGWTVDVEGRPVPIQYGHIAILMRRFSSFSEDVTRNYVKALEARRIPHVLVGGRNLHGREEVMALTRALVAIEWPDDALSVYAVLRGPFFGFADDVLLRYSQAAPLHPFAPDTLGGTGGAGGSAATKAQETPAGKESNDADAVRGALALLRRLHDARNRIGVATTILQFVSATRALASLAFWPAGEQALANVLRVLDLARAHDRRGGTSFRAFVARMESEADTAEASAVEDDVDGVRIMTVHKAKGLEFPVVILADPGCPLLHEQASRFVDTANDLSAFALCGAQPLPLLEAEARVLAADREEAIRLAYVAATRARDILVVPILGEGPSESAGEENWLAPLGPSIYPKRRDYRESEPGPFGFGLDSVAKREEKTRATLSDVIRPGIVRPEVGEHRVLCWDPTLLGEPEDVPHGVRQQQLLAAEEPLKAASAAKKPVPGLTNVPSSGRTSTEVAMTPQVLADARSTWRREREAVRKQAGMPSMQLWTVTGLVHDAPVASTVQPLSLLGAARDVPVRWFDLRPEKRGSAGSRFGTLTHRLVHVARRYPELALDAAAEVEARLLGADKIERADAVAAASLFWASEQGRAIRSAARVETEALLSRCEREDGQSTTSMHVVEGVVDLAFCTEEGIWTIVDVKTHLPEDAQTRMQYERQVRIYAQLLADALMIDVGTIQLWLVAI